MRTNTFASLRQEMVRSQLKARGICDPVVLAAMNQVPREDFISSSHRLEAYSDRSLPIEEGQTISQPYIVALMAEALQIKPGDRILEIGTGSGYAAAVLSLIATEVYTIEYFPKLAQVAQKRFQEHEYNNIYLRQGDGNLGWPEHSPYQGISVTAGAPRIPSELLSQLAINGRLVMPVGPDSASQKLILAIKKENSIIIYLDLADVRFVPLLGDAPSANN